jgi:hypothetical protein
MRTTAARSLNRLKRRIRLAYREAPVRLDRMRGKRILHFLHIGKTGGTAVLTALLGVDDRRYRFYYRGHHGTLADVQAGDSCFFFVRDPVTRFVSAFHSRQREGRPRYYYPWNAEERTAFERFKTPNELAVALSSDDADTRAAAERAMRGIKHIKTPLAWWSGTEEYLRQRRSAVLFVGAQEQLTEDFARLKALLGIEATLAQDEVTSHRNPGHLDRTLDPSAIENLRTWYAADYTRLTTLREWFPHLPDYEASRVGGIG